MLIPMILGVAAIAFFTGCRREESPPQSGTEPEPHRSTSPPSPLLINPSPSPTPSAAPPGPSFSEAQCNAQASRPERFVIQDARAEFCRLHEILYGQTCRAEGSSVQFQGERGSSSLIRLFGEMNRTHDYALPLRDPALREKWDRLEGLRMYLYSGQPCRLDNETDLLDMVGAYTLYDAVRTTQNLELARGFREGRVGCILRRGLIVYSGPHDHQDAASGVRIHHETSDTHDEIFTQATLRLNPTLPPDTPVSDCLVVR